MCAICPHPSNSFYRAMMSPPQRNKWEVKGNGAALTFHGKCQDFNTLSAVCIFGSVECVDMQFSMGITSVCISLSTCCVRVVEVCNRFTLGLLVPNNIFVFPSKFRNWGFPFLIFQYKKSTGSGLIRLYLDLLGHLLCQYQQVEDSQNEKTEEVNEEFELFLEANNTLESPGNTVINRSEYL